MIFLFSSAATLLAFIVLLSLLVRFICCAFSKKSRENFKQHPYIHIILTVVCLLIVINQSCGSLGHGGFEIPVKITSEKEIEEIEYCTYHSLGTRETKQFKKENERWRSIGFDDSGAYSARVVFSGGSNGCFRKKWTYIHAAGIGIKLKYSDGSESIFRFPLQQHPRANIIELEL